MRLIKLQDFRDTRFEGNPPTLRTLKRWPECVKRGGHYYMDLDAFVDAASNDEFAGDPDADFLREVKRVSAQAN